MSDKYICLNNCSDKEVLEQLNGRGKPHNYKKDRVYIVKICSGIPFIHSNGNGYDVKLINRTTMEFIQKNFKRKFKDEDELLNQVDLLFENIFFNHG